MIVIHIESGLGNQMLTYLEFLAIKTTHPNTDIYFESTVYECEEALKVVNMWNGYEIEQCFNLKLPNIKELFSKKEWDDIIYEIKETKWWNKKWDWAHYIYPILKKHGVDIDNNYAYSMPVVHSSGACKLFIKKMFGGILYSYYRKFKDFYMYKKLSKIDHSDELFYKGKDSFYCGQTLKFSQINFGLEKIQNEVLRTFQFDNLDLKNIEYGNKLASKNSIAIHVRRSDMLGWSFIYFKNGYYKNALKKIKKKIGNKYNVVFFTDPGSVEWVKNNLKVFGLTNNDEITYANINRGNDSYKDLYLMSKCKFSIITCSSFGWWGTFLNTMTDCYSISPYGTLFNTTSHA